jgi:hypothetical protein
VSAQPDHFKLITQIVAAGGHDTMTDEFDRDKYIRLVEALPKTRAIRPIE